MAGTKGKPKGKQAAPKAKAKPAAPRPSTRPSASLRASGSGGAAKRAATERAATKQPSSADFLALVEVFTERPGVTRARMMGCDGLRLANKYFVMEWRGELVVKLPRDTVNAYAASGRGTHFDPGMGRPMKEWLTVPAGVADWRQLAEQAFTFVAASL